MRANRIIDIVHRDEPPETALQRLAKYGTALTVLPIEPGQQAIRVTGVGDLGVQDEFQQAVVVETQSELQFSVADVADPIEVGTDTTYDVRITNRGTRAATTPTAGHTRQKRGR